MAQVLDGKQVRDAILSECQPRVERLVREFRRPGLAVVLVGQNPASEIYVRNKVKACEELGIYSEAITPPATITTEELLSVIARLNERDEIDGILVQMPLPPQVDARQVLLAIDPAKDVDGFHPMNVGNLVAGIPGPRPCTPSGIMEMLRRYDIPVAGRRAVVVGRSDIVGKPMALLLVHAHATVTICHSRTSNLPEVCREADILVAALGRPAALGEEHIRPGATVIDVGINRLTRQEEVDRLLAGVPAKVAQFEKAGSVVVGDVHPGAMAKLAGAYTPVPGGVGPLTIAMLMANTVESAERRRVLCSV